MALSMKLFGLLVAEASFALMAVMIKVAAPAASMSIPPVIYAPPALEYDCLALDEGEQHKDECQDAPTKEKE